MSTNFLNKTYFNMNSRTLSPTSNEAGTIISPLINQAMIAYGYSFYRNFYYFSYPHIETTTIAKQKISSTILYGNNIAHKS